MPNKMSVLPLPLEALHEVQSIANLKTWRETDPKVTHPHALEEGHLTLSIRNARRSKEPPVSRLIYGGFLEHAGKCIYGGLVDDPAHPSPANLLLKQSNGGLGWRKDVLDILSKELQVPLFRWPGGNFVSNYHWQDGIGPIESRPKRTELAWQFPEPNLFGTDEYLTWSQAAGAEPFICLNLGTGTLEEALAWVEYCNGNGDTHWANLRRKHTGKSEPYGVKYWGLGNEMWGTFQVGHLTPVEYTRRAQSWGRALKTLDPSITLISCGKSGCAEWDLITLRGMTGIADLHSMHMYTMFDWANQSGPGFGYEKSVFGPAGAESQVQICKTMIETVNMDRCLIGLPPAPMKISFDEWNVWDNLKAPADGEYALSERYNYTDMLAMAGWLHVLLRQHSVIAVGCLAQSVNVISPLMASPEGIVRQTTFYPLKYFCRYMHSGHVLDLPKAPDGYTGPTCPTWIQGNNLRPAYVDTVALYVKESDGEHVRISTVNRHPEADWSTSIDIPGFEPKKATITEYYSDDVLASNWHDDPEHIVPTTKDFPIADLTKGLSVRKHSWVFLDILGQAK